jgi:hypothetical protein
MDLHMTVQKFRPNDHPIVRAKLLPSDGAACLMLDAGSNLGRRDFVAIGNLSQVPMSRASPIHGFVVGVFEPFQQGGVLHRFFGSLFVIL